MNLETLKRLSKLNPDRFTIEDVSDILHVRLSTARKIMETGVRRGEFITSGQFYSLAKRAA